MIISHVLAKDARFVPKYVTRLFHSQLSSYIGPKIWTRQRFSSALSTRRTTFSPSHPRFLSTSAQTENHVDSGKATGDSLVVAGDSAPLELNKRQLCLTSHQNFLVYAYNNFDFNTIIKITNQVLAPYQTFPRKKTEAHRRQYLAKFLKCIAKHKPEADHQVVANWLIRSIDLLTSHDMYSMLRVRYILNYVGAAHAQDNSFETLRHSHGMDTLEKFSSVHKAKEARDKALEEKAANNKTARRNLLMRYLKINKLKFLRDQNITVGRVHAQKAVYEAKIDWRDETVDAKELEEQRFALLYNLPYVEREELAEHLSALLAKFGRVRALEVCADRVPPLTRMQRANAGAKNPTHEPRGKYSPLYAIAGRRRPRAEFEDRAGRDALCRTNLRAFGILFLGRLIYPELAEHKHSLITALYPPFRKMAGRPRPRAGALQFVANTLVDVHDDLEDQAHGRPRARAEPSTCTITPFTRRRRRHGGQLVVTAEKHAGHEEDARPIRDNHIDASMLEDVKKQARAEADPQWIVLRFDNFKSAYFARRKLAEQLAHEPRSFVSFDTKRSVFHNGKYLDLPLFRYGQGQDSDVTHTTLSRSMAETDSQ